MSSKWILGVFAPVGIEHVEFETEAEAIQHALREDEVPGGYHACELKGPDDKVVLDLDELHARMAEFGKTAEPMAPQSFSKRRQK